MWLQTLGTLVMFAAGTAGEGLELERHEYRKIVMAVDARVVLYAPDEETARAAAAAAFARMEELDAVLSHWRDDSELARVNAAAGGAPVRASADLVRVLALARDCARATDGAFDPTVGGVLRARKEGGAPGPVGWERIELDLAEETVRLAERGMALDLGAIGKGFACDEAYAVLEARGLSRALVELGGDLWAGDPPPGAEGWSVRAICAGAQDVELSVRRRGVATSRSASTLIDPRAGAPWIPAGAERCCTVIASSAALADAFATAGCVLETRAVAAVVAAARSTGLDPGLDVRVDGRDVAERR